MRFSVGRSVDWRSWSAGARVQIPGGEPKALRHPQKVCEEHIKPFAIMQSVCWRIDLVLTTANIAQTITSA
jgi:hypothetical protein